MLSSDIPALLPIPFANNAGGSYRRTIPTAHSATPGAASFYDGFPPECFLPPLAGGIPPFGQDFNGILYQVTGGMRWLQSGGMAAYDAGHSADIGGYANKAVLLAADGTHWWRSTADNNTSNPDTGGANWVVVQPGTYPWTSITGAPTFVLLAAFTGTNQSLSANGYQKWPGGRIDQECDVFVAGAFDTLVTVTYPISFPNIGKRPLVSIQDPSESSPAGNFLGMSIVSYSNSGCVIALDGNGGSGRDVTVHVEVTGN